MLVNLYNFSKHVSSISVLGCGCIHQWRMIQSQAKGLLLRVVISGTEACLDVAIYTEPPTASPRYSPRSSSHSTMPASDYAPTPAAPQRRVLTAGALPLLMWIEISCFVQAREQKGTFPFLSSVSSHSISNVYVVKETSSGMQDFYD